MPSTITTPIAARIPNEQADLLRRHAARSGLTLSRALSVMVARGLDEHAADPTPHALTTSNPPGERTDP